MHTTYSVGMPPSLLQHLQDLRKNLGLFSYSLTHFLAHPVIYIILRSVLRSKGVDVEWGPEMLLLLWLQDLDGYRSCLIRGIGQ